MTTDQFKLLTVEVENFKNITHRLVKLDGKSAYIIGGNGKGKSSLIDAMLSPVDSSYVPAQPININSEDHRGVIRLQLGDGTDTYDINVVFTPSSRTGNVTLFHNGLEVKGAPRNKIKTLFGEFSFDIYEFMKMSFPEKVKYIKKAAGVENEISELDEQRATLMAEKLRIEKNIAEMKAVNDKKYRPFTQEEIEKYAEAIDVAAIQNELAELQPAIERWNRVNSGVKNSEVVIRSHQVSADHNKAEALRANQEIADLYKRIEVLMTKQHEHEEAAAAAAKQAEEETIRRDKGVAWLAENPCPDTLTISNKIAEANEHNRMVSIIAEYRERHKELHAKVKEAEKIVSKIKEVDSKKEQIIESSQLPVKGLRWDDKHIYLDGIPLESGQVNTQKILDVAAELSMANNNRLKLVVIREGSLFDKQHLNDLLKRISDRGYQWIVEIVDPEGNDVEVKFEETDLH